MIYTNFLEELKKEILDGVWVLLGDFIVTFMTMGPAISPDVKEFGDGLDYLDVLLFLLAMAHLLLGLTFKVGRVLISPSWLTVFPQPSAQFLAPGVSNHCLHAEIVVFSPLAFQVFQLSD